MIYLSFDMESNGPSPVHHSMLSIGIVPVVERIEGAEVLNPRRHFYAVMDLMPGKEETDSDTQRFWDRFPERWEDARKCPGEVPTVMRGVLGYYYRMLAWGIETGTLKPGERPVFAARPAAFDFHWLRHYMFEHLPEEWVALGHVSYTCIDIASVIAGRLRVSYEDASRTKRWPKEWVIENKRPHHALDDALQQAHLLCGVLNHQG